MTKIDIPQEENSTLNGQQKVMYAPNTNGEFQTFNYGSEVEEYATKLAVEEYEILMAQSLKDIKRNISSPIEYYMFKNRMDLPTLASAVDMFAFRVKRHLRADIYKKLNDKMLNKYAFAFQIELEELKGFTGE
jgi:hypothetical protein